MLSEERSDGQTMAPQGPAEVGPGPWDNEHLGVAFAVLTPGYSEWDWKPYRAAFFLDREQAAKWAQRECGVVVSFPVIADYSQSGAIKVVDDA